MKTNVIKIVCDADFCDRHTTLDPAFHDPAFLTRLMEWESERVGEDGATITFDLCDTHARQEWVWVNERPFVQPGFVPVFLTDELGWVKEVKE